MLINIPYTDPGHFTDNGILSLKILRKVDGYRACLYALNQVTVLEMVF